MGYRFRKSKNIGKYLRVNVSSKGIGYSVGTKGFRVSVGADGKVRQTTSIPGTGIYNTKVVSSASSSSSANTTATQQFNSPCSTRFPFGWLFLLFLSIGLCAFVFWLLSIGGYADSVIVVFCAIVFTVSIVLFANGLIKIHRYSETRNNKPIISPAPVKDAAPEISIEPEDELQKLKNQLELTNKLIVKQKNTLNTYEKLVAELDTQVEGYKKKLELAEALIAEHEMQEALYEKQIVLLQKRLALYEPDITKEG